MSIWDHVQDEVVSGAAKAGKAAQKTAVPEMERSPLVRVEHVDKTFANGTTALKGLNLTVGRHEFLALLGPSGCGKSTALRLLAGLARPSRGRVSWTESGLAGEQPRTGRVGFVFQDATLMPWATVFDNVFLPLRLAGQTRKAATERVEDALATVGLAEFRRAYPRELSGGMRMRVSIARALVTDPEILLMDEPFAALDEITRFKLNDDLLRLWQEKSWTVVFVTHSVFESVFLAQRVVVMAARPGRIASELIIGAPYPRDAGFRTGPDYGRFCREASAALHEAIAAPSALTTGEA